MRLMRETYHLFVEGRKEAAAQIELVFEDDQNGDLALAGAKVFALDYGSFALEGVTALQSWELLQSAPIERAADNVIQFPKSAQQEDARP